MRRLIVCLAVVHVLFFPHICSARTASMTSLQDIYFSSATASAQSLLYLAPPPAPGSAAQAVNLIINNVVQATSSPQAVAQAQLEGSAPSVFAFASVLGASFIPRNFPVTKEFFTKLSINTQNVNNILKGFYNSPGPQSAATYPSNHALLGAMDGILLGAMIPEKQLQLQTFGVQFGLERLVVNAHWPTDIFGAQREATLLLANLFANPQFQSDFNAAKAEVRSALLGGTEESLLSGYYTSYNNYLESVLAEGQLKRVQAKFGGQVHADAASYVLRQPQLIDDAISPYISSRQLPEGRPMFWLAGFGGGFWNKGHNGTADSTEYNAGSIAGASYRFNSQACAHFGLGYNWGTIGSADATATMNTVLATLGGRYAFSSLESGPFVDARGNAAWLDYQSWRTLDGGMGNALGNANGAMYSGRVGVGHVLRFAPFSITPQVGGRMSGLTLGGFTERDSDVGLNVHGQSKTTFSFLADLEFACDPLKSGDWFVTPAASLGYERLLNNPQVTSTGTFYGYAVSPQSAYDARNLLKAGLGVTVGYKDFAVTARGNGLLGDDARSAGVSGQLSMSYTF